MIQYNLLFYHIFIRLHFAWICVTSRNYPCLVHSLSNLKCCSFNFTFCYFAHTALVFSPFVSFTIYVELGFAILFVNFKLRDQGYLAFLSITFEFIGLFIFVSAVLAAGAPEVAPFMADECLMSMPEVEGIDYTMKEYMKLVAKTKECVDRLNAQGGSWNPHKVEMTIWAYYIARDLKPEILDDMPDSRGNTYGVTEPVKEVVAERVNGENGVNGEVSKENGDEVMRNSVDENLPNGISEDDNIQKSVHSLSPEPEAEPVGFTPEPMGFDYNGVGSAAEANDASNGSSEPAEEMSTGVPEQSEVEERQVNGESIKEESLLGNGGSYKPYTEYTEPAPVYSTPHMNLSEYHAPAPTPVAEQYATAPAPVDQYAPLSSSVEHYAPAPTPVEHHIQAALEPLKDPVCTKRHLEEIEEATPDSKRVREDLGPSINNTLEVSSNTTSHISEELPTGVVPVVPAAVVTECPAPNGVISAPPQPIHTGGD